MLPAPARVVACLAALLIGPAGERAPDPAIPNADFEAAEEQQPADWGWWSREGGGSATVVAGKGREGSQCVFIQHDDERDWAFCKIRSTGAMW